MQQTYAMANLLKEQILPMQLRGPSPKANQVVALRVLFASLSNRSGSKRSGFG